MSRDESLTAGFEGEPKVTRLASPPPFKTAGHPHGGRRDPGTRPSFAPSDYLLAYAPAIHRLSHFLHPAYPDHPTCPPTLPTVYLPYLPPATHVARHQHRRLLHHLHHLCHRATLLLGLPAGARAVRCTAPGVLAVHPPRARLPWVLSNRHAQAQSKRAQTPRPDLALSTPLSHHRQQRRRNVV